VPVIEGPAGQPETLNLGGGFVFLRRPDGHAAIVASGLAGSGAIGIMSAADVNARSDEDLRRWLTCWAFPDHARLRKVNQVHGAHVVAAASYDGTSPDADGMWTQSPADVLIVKTADCAPVWLVDPEQKVVAVLHAGWRGVADGIASEGIQALTLAGANPENVRAAIGPHIRPCCFEVGPEVAQRFADIPGAVRPAESLVAARRRADSVALDLGAVIQTQLASSGVQPDRIDAASTCTHCSPKLLHSYRRNGSGGPLMAAVGAVLP
jgi:polyphenol oxidase